MMFLKETAFQDSRIGKIPEDWNGVRINKISEVHRGASPRPIGDPAYFSETGRGWIRISDVTNTYKYLRSTSQYLSEIGESKSVKVDPGDLVMSICATIGKPIIIDMKACIHDGFVVFRNLSKDVDTEFLFYLLQKNEHRFRSMKQTGTQGNLNTTLVGETLIPIPSLAEQKTIVNVLGVVDSAILKVDEVIWKTERLKKGLMQQLLTRGIGHKEYKDTPIGKTPKDWDVRKLEDVILEAKSGFASGARDENGILQLRMDSISTEGWINKESGVKVPIPCDVEKYFVRPGDVLFNNTNSVDLIGKTAIFRGEFPRCVYSNHLTRIRARTSEAIPEWLSYLLIRRWQLGFFKRICHRHVHQAGINNSEITRLQIPVPKIHEQQKIVEILSTADKKLQLERKEKARLERIKSGIMDLLLTGRVRVMVD
jgi:type I restriction enzyme S subunit